MSITMLFQPWTWGLLGGVCGVTLERLILRMPNDVLAPYAGQYDDSEWVGPGGGLSLRPSLARKITLFCLCAVTWLGLAMWHSDAPLRLLAWTFCFTTLLILACIDWNTTLLPDALVLPLLWAGLLASERGLSLVSLPASVWSVAAWYLLLLGIGTSYQRLRGRMGMGQGDAKLMAAMAAWWGWEPVLWAMLAGSVLLLAFALLRQKARFSLKAELPYGPFLITGMGLWSVGQGLQSGWGFVHVAPLFSLG